MTNINLITNPNNEYLEKFKLIQNELILMNEEIEKLDSKSCLKLKEKYEEFKTQNQEEYNLICLIKRNRMFYESQYFSENRIILQAIKDYKLITSRCQNINEKKGPQVGLFLKINDNNYTRFTHHWGDSLQTGGSTQGSYYLSNSLMSYSGGLDPSMPIEFLIETDEIKNGSIWIFSDNYPGAHREIYNQIPLKVFKIKTDEQTLNTIKEIIKNDVLPDNHPLLIFTENSPQYINILTQYYYFRNTYRNQEALLKNCIISR